MPVTATNILGELGVSIGLAIDAGPVFMAQGPYNTEPSSSAYKILVTAYQNGLNRLGANLVVDAKIGPAMRYAAQQVSGDNWEHKKWFQLFIEVLDADKKGLKIIPGAGISLYANQKVGGIPVWAMGLGAVGLWMLWGKKKGRR